MFTEDDSVKSAQKKIKNPGPTTLKWDDVFPSMKKGKTTLQQFMGDTKIMSIRHVQQAFIKKAATLAVDEKIGK